MNPSILFLHARSRRALGFALGLLVGTYGALDAQEPVNTMTFPVESSSAQVLGASLGDATVPVADGWALGVADELLWTAGALQRVLEERDYAAVLLVGALGRWSENGGSEALDRARPLVAALAGGTRAVEGVQRCRNAVDAVEGALCALEDLVPRAPSGLARELVEEGARLIAFAQTPEAEGGARGAALATGLRTLDPLQRYAELTLERTWDIAHRSQGSAMEKPLDDLLSGTLGFSPAMGAQAVLARMPDLEGLLARYPVLGMSDGGAGDPVAFDVRPFQRDALTLKVAGHETVVREYRAFLTAVTGSVRDALVVPGGDDGFAVSALQGSGARAAEWAAQRSFVYVASRSAALDGGVVGVAERIRALGNAAVDLRTGALSFSTQLGTAGRETAMAVLTGNLFAVATQVTSFFGLGPAALGSGAAGEVRALRAAVDTMQLEMHERFDRVETQLDSLFGIVDDRFGRIEQLVATGNASVRAELASVHTDMMGLGRRTERMEANLRSYMEAGFDRDYTRTLIRCLEHRQRLLPPYDEMEFGIFAGCLADFRARAVQDARDALLADQTTPTDDPSVATALEDLSVQSLARRLPLLGRVAEQRFGYPALRGGRGIANPLEWGVATQAYLTMLRDWPEHARAVATGDLEAMRAVGVDLRDVLRAVAVEPTSGRPGALLERTLARYDASAQELFSEADVLARRHQQEGLRRVAPESVLNRMEPAEPARTPLDVPAVIAVQIPQEVRTAAVLGLGEATLVYRLARTDSVSRQNSRHAVLFFGRRHDRLTFTRTAMEVELRFGNEGSLATFRAVGPWVHRLTEEMGGEETSEDVRSRREHVHDPDAHFLATDWSGVAADREIWEGTAVAPTSLARIEGAIEAELRRYASVGLTRVFGTTCAPEPASVSIEGPDGESATRIRQILDRMTAARRLLQAYVLLGLPTSAEHDATLRAGLFGPDGIPDRGALCGAVLAGESALRLIWLDDEPRQRSTTMAATLAAVLHGPDAVHQPLDLVEGTLDRIEAALRVQRLRTLAARADG